MQSSTGTVERVVAPMSRVSNLLCCGWDKSVAEVKQTVGDLQCLFVYLFGEFRDAFLYVELTVLSSVLDERSTDAPLCFQPPI